MSMVSLLPADKYVIVNKTILTESDKKNLISLYEPIIGPNAVSLYLTFWRDLDRYYFVSVDYNHHHLMTILKQNLDSIKLARETLEAAGLIRTYFQEGEPNSYVYELYSPLSPKEFFQNPIFNVVLYNNVGRSEYELLKEEYKEASYNLKDYEEITMPLDRVFKVSNEVVDTTFDGVERKTLPLTIVDQVDFDLILSSIPKGILNERSLTKKMKELINNLSFAYGIDTLKMSEIIRLAINEKGFIDKDSLRIEARKYFQYNNHGRLPTLVYRKQPEYLKSPEGDKSKRGRIIEVFENTTPYDFLRFKYKNVQPTNRDLRLLENLLVDLELKPAVVNVLIDYVLRKNNNKLNTAFVETIAGQWKREGVETAKDAMDLAEKENKSYTKKYNKEAPKSKIVEESVTPVWFNTNINKEEINEEEKEELESMLEKYGN